jgi:hypothetical protein
MRTEPRIDAATVAAFDSFLVAGVLGVYLKLSLLGPQWGAIARFLGGSSPDAVPPSVRLGLFVHDIWLNLLAIPLLLTAFVVVAFPRRRAIVAFAMSALMSIAYFIELQVQQEVGEYLSGVVADDVIGWTLAATGTAVDYVTPGSLFKLAALLIALPAIAAIERLHRRTPGTRTALVTRRILALPGLAAAVMAAVTAASALRSPLASSPLTETAIGRASRVLFRAGDVPGILSGDVDSVLATFRSLTSTAPLDPRHAYVGREQQSDAIVFVMETGAARAFDPAIDGRTLPGIGQLYDKAFVTSRHYTSHPYSSDALYSIFSGLYPRGRRRLLRASGSSKIAGLMTSLDPGVSMRRVYVPSLYYIELDDRMYEAFGADAVYASDAEQDPSLHAAAELRTQRFLEGLERDGSQFDRRRRARLEARLRADLQALERLKVDVADNIRSGRRYTVMFFPEIGHGPWVALRNEPTVLERGRTLMRLQDAWLKEILDLVRGFGRMDRTVVIVTGDHGVRTRAEDPSLPIGAISDYMFRVPLVVYAPQTLTTTVAIDRPTSHIDIAPTLLALAGRASEAAGMQGVPIWQRGTGDRIYLLAFDYGGAEGFVENGRYYMRQGVTGAVFESPRLSFDAEQQIAPRDPKADYVTDALKQLEALQQALVSHTIDGLRR